MRIIAARRLALFFAGVGIAGMLADDALLTLLSLAVVLSCVVTGFFRAR